VIQLSLQLRHESTITLQELCDEALTAVISELENAGYTVGPPIKQETGENWLHSAVIEPGPADLNVSAKWGNDLNIILTGPRFRGDYTDDRDAALWDSLDALREQLITTYGLDGFPLRDPGFATGEPGAPGTYLPNDLFDKGDSDDSA
jgi:hypothetical protein